MSCRSRFRLAPDVTVVTVLLASMLATSALAEQAETRSEEPAEAGGEAASEASGGELGSVVETEATLPAYVSVVTPSEELQDQARALTRSLRIAIDQSRRFSTEAVQSRLFGRSPESARALAEASELFLAGRTASENLELDRAQDLLSQAVELYVRNVAELDELDPLVQGLFQLGVVETLRENTRQAQRAFSRVVAIDGEFRPNPDLFPPSIIRAFRRAAESYQRRRTGELEVVTEPAGAELYLDERYLGLSPQTLPEVGSGRHFVWAQRPGYARAGAEVLVRGRRSARVSLSLNELAGGDLGELSANLTEALLQRPEDAGDQARSLGSAVGAEMLFLGVLTRAEGQGRLQLYAFQAGNAELVARTTVEVAATNEAGQPPAGEVWPAVTELLAQTWRALHQPPPTLAGAEDVAPGDDSVSERKPVWRRWWFWTIIGVALVGASVGAGFGIAAAVKDKPSGGEVILDM